MINKGSDKNVANIEVIEDFILELKSFGLNKDTLEVANELENLLAEREQMLREKQDDKQDIKDFQNALNEENLRCANYAIENNELKKRIQELKEERDHWNGCFIVAMENSIATQKVIDKIKELKNNIKNGNTRYPYIEEHKIEILEELLGGGK